MRRVFQQHGPQGDIAKVGALFSNNVVTKIDAFAEASSVSAPQPQHNSILIVSIDRWRRLAFTVATILFGDLIAALILHF
ncbi:hypothetical protein [Pararhizobium sp. DWP3-4]|uniref:hypothetical protein n=1 Tax=Pararhizobium sp. DWP3-4 TaxID=2804565 RepID=UPI003CF60A5A